MFELIDHVGVAVADLDSACRMYEEGYSAAFYRRERLEAELVEVAAYRVGDSLIELLAPTSPDSVIARYIEKRGEGLHHIAYRVADCAAALRELRERGFEMIDEAPRPGFDNTLVGFVHPKSAGGILTELVQQQ
jgi:methylmalonyl-CoA epimerase